MNKVHGWGLTDVGRKRDHNEDNYICSPKFGLFAVADGMGGHEAGEVASQIVVDELEARVSSAIKKLREPGLSSAEDERQWIRSYLDETIQRASHKVFTLGQEHGGKGMGTTLSAVLTLGDMAAIVHIGDSRCYLLRDGDLFQLTEDHTLVLQQLKMGLITEEEAANSRYKNVITRAVGMADRVQVDLFFVDLVDGDRLMLCSDGLHGYLSHEEVAHMMSTNAAGALPQKMIDLANERGGKDNITVLSVAVRSRRESSEGTEIRDGIGILGSTPFFEEMSNQELLRLLPLTSVREYHPGQQLLREGEQSSHLYIVMQGSLAVYQNGEVLATLTEGDYVGEMSIFDGEAASATVVAQEMTRCIAVQREDLLALIKQEPEIAFKVLMSFIQVMAFRLRNTSRDLSWLRREWRRGSRDG